MKVLDWRPPWIRLFSNHKPSGSHLLSRASARIVRYWVNRRVEHRPEPPQKPFLISVGNLALGGTGKTPVVMDLAASFARRGIPGAILTRGYGSSLSGPLVVEPDNRQAGDEARLMSERLMSERLMSECLPSERLPWKSWPVIQAAQRSTGLVACQEIFPDREIVLLEDAHQSAGLPRHLDLVIVDSWAVREAGSGPVLVPATGPVFPFGAWREDAAGARRAAALLVEGEGHIPRMSSHQQKVFSFHREQSLSMVQGNHEGKDLRWGLISGIARPEPFENAACRALEGEVGVSIRLRDHAPYDRGLVQKCRATFAREGVEAILTTAKDWIKLRTFWDDPRPLAILDLHIVWDEKNALDRWLVERADLADRFPDQSGSRAP